MNIDAFQRRVLTVKKPYAMPGQEFIPAFEGAYRFLSNNVPASINWGGIQFPTVEHAYQASKTIDIDMRIHIASLKTPGDAKRWGKLLDIVPNWLDIRAPTMRELLS